MPAGDAEASFAFDLVEAPSLVVDVAFGDDHANAIERERQRTREVIEEMTGDTGASKAR